MNLVLLLLFSWAILFFIFHRYHSGQYYQSEGFQVTGSGNGTGGGNGTSSSNVTETSSANGNENENENDSANGDENETLEEEEEIKKGDQGLNQRGNAENVNIFSNDLVKKHPDVKNCLFVPRGHSVQSCIDRCHNREDRKYWGGNNCTNRNCTKICTGCKSKDHCDWITSENVYEDVTVPNPPPKQEITVLAGDSRAVIMWSSIENKGQNNSSFLVKYFKTYKPFEGVRVASIVVEEKEKKNFTYTLENLDNNEFYSVGVMAVNETDVGPMSNIEQITPKENKEILTN